jgi:dihydroorotase
MTLVIKGGRILDPSRGIDAVGDLLIEDGKIVASEGKTHAKGDVRVFDAAGKWVLPGAVDGAVHLSEPARADRETVASLGRAAAAGGVTSAVCRPNADLRLDNIATLEFIYSKNRREGLVRLYPAAALTRGREGAVLTDIGDLVTGGAVAVGDGRAVMSSLVMRRGLEYARSFGVPLITFPQDESLARGGVMNEGAVATALGLRGVPASAEEVIVIRDIILARMTGWRVHISPVTTAGAVELVRRAKADGLRVTCDTAPHYFTLTEEATEGYNTFAKVSPPLRTAVDGDALVAGLRDGTVDAVASDHQPLTIIDKDIEFAAAAFGISALETFLPLAFTALVARGGIAALRFAELVSTYPARLFGLPAGTLAPGAPADVVVVDVECEKTVAAESFLARGKNTPFEGNPYRGCRTTHPGAVLNLPESKEKPRLRAGVFYCGLRSGVYSATTILLAAVKFGVSRR